MHLLTLLKSPPGGGGGWVYKQEETGLWMKGITFQQLLSKVSQHRSNMKLPHFNPPFNTLAEEIEDWICRRMDPKTQTENCVTGIRHRTSVHWNELLEFIKANAKWFISGKTQVPQDEAERRAAICANCPMNVRTHGCGVCEATLKEYRDSVVKGSTTKDNQIQACGVCGCDLKSIVHLPLSVLKKDRPMDFPDWCWQNPSQEPPPSAPQNS